MVVITKRINIVTKGENDVVDITDDIHEAIMTSKTKCGVAVIFVSGSTAAITTIEYETGLVNDFVKMLDRLAPEEIDYEHHKRWNDDNGRSHVKASLLGPDLVVPFTENRMELGKWQRVVLVELDTRSRNRIVLIQIIGQ